MLKQWIEVEGHIFILKTLKVKTHRDGLFLYKSVYFTVEMIFSQLLGHQSYSNVHCHNRGDGILYSAKYAVIKSKHSVFTKKYIALYCKRGT